MNFTFEILKQFYAWRLNAGGFTFVYFFLELYVNLQNLKCSNSLQDKNVSTKLFADKELITYTFHSIISLKNEAKNSCMQKVVEDEFCHSNNHSLNSKLNK